VGTAYQYIRFGFKGYYFISIPYSEYRFSSSAIPFWNVNEKKTMAIISDGSYHRLFINNVNALGGQYLKVSGFDSGFLGLYAVGPVNYQNPTLVTKTTITVNLGSSCMTVDQYKASLKSTLGLSDFQIENAVYNLNCSTSKRNVGGGAGTVTFTLVGSNSASSTALASQLSAKIASSHPSILQNFGSISQPTVSTTTPLASQIFTLTPAATVASTLPYIIAGSVAGAVALAGIGAGIYYAVKKKKDDNKKPEKTPEKPKEEPKVVQEPPPPQEDPKPEKYKPKGATVNIFELDPNDPQSLTARNPGYKN